MLIKEFCLNYQMKTSTLNKVLYGALFIAIWACTSFFYDSLILPTPLEVLITLIKIVTLDDFITILSNTLLRLIFALFISIFTGFCLGILISLNNVSYRILSPILLFFQSAPIISFILLGLIWFETSTIPLFILNIYAIPQFTISIYEGIKGINKKLLDMSKFYRVKKYEMVIHLYLPSILTNIIGISRIILSNSLKVFIMAEVISKSPKSIGSKINWAWINIETSHILAWTFIVIIISYIFEKVFIHISSKYLRRYYD